MALIRVVKVEFPHLRIPLLHCTFLLQQIIYNKAQRQLFSYFWWTPGINVQLGHQQTHYPVP